VNFHSFKPELDQHIDVQGNHKELIRKMGADSTVLLKNEQGILPLKSPDSMAIIGSNSGPGKK
jgi:beta-glucosidase